MRKRRSPFQRSYLTLLSVLTISCCAALTIQAIEAWPSPVLLLAIGAIYALVEWFGVKIPTRRPGSFVELTVTDAVVIFGILVTGSSTLLPVLVASCAVRYLQRQFEQPLGYFFNTALRALGITVWLAFVNTTGLSAQALNGFTGALAMLGWMVLYPIWTSLYLTVLVAVGSDQPAPLVFREQFLSTLWVDSIVVAFGVLSAFLYVSNPWLVLPLALLLLLAYQAIGAVVRRFELTHQVEQLNDQLQMLNQGLEQQVADRTADLQRALRVKDDFVAVVAHELRTPVAAILGSLGILNDMLQSPDSPQARRLIELSYRNSERLTRMVNDILDVQRLSTDRVTFDLQPIVLGDLAQQAIDSLESIATGLSVRIELSNDAIKGTITVDRDRMIQIIINLLSNACKFSPVDGTVKVKIQVDEQMVRLSVSDCGPGIPEDFQSRLFEPFAQADTSPGRRHGGTGLGLFIAKAFAERMGGQISFVTQPGQGTTFTVGFPLAQTINPTVILDTLQPTTTVGGAVALPG